MTDNNDLDDNNDELNSQHELASAYLDDVASPAERAAVDASPELQSIVASFAVVRAKLADVHAVAETTREAAFAAAFAEFDAPATVAVAATAAVIPLSSKRRWTRPLMSAAAAVLLVGAIGIAASGSLSGNDSESSSMDTSTDTAAKVAAADAATESQMSADTMAGAAPAATIGAIPSGGAQTAIVIDSPEALQALSISRVSDVMPTIAMTETTAAASESTDSAATIPPAELDAVSAYAGAAMACLTEQQVFLADIQYQGAFAIAALDTVTGMTSAITDDCTVLATVGP